MTFTRIDQAHHPYLIPIRAWYEESFPEDERRSFNALLELLPCPDMHLCGLVDEEKLIGFIIYWEWPEFTFVEHFAIDPGYRSKQLGQRAIRQLLCQSSPYFILEVELPQDHLSCRRVQFYERQGFSLNIFVYAQPPYQRGNPPIPMQLMSTPPIANQEEFTQLSQLIYDRVYERFY